MAAQGEGAGNGRVTLAVIKSQLDTVISNQKEFKEVYTTLDGRVGSLEVGQAERKTQIENIKKDVSDLESTSKSWTILNAIATFIAWVLAGIGISR